MSAESTESVATPPREFSVTFRDKGLWIIVALTLVVAGIAQLIGMRVLPLGSATITFLPMIWALLLGVLISGQRWKPLPVDMQHTANAVMAIAVLVLCARLSLTLGPNVPALVEAGPALLLQELGNVFGSILLALPLAVLLRMGPATIGATFSIDREPSFAMVTSRYGSDSPQYRGVLSMYVFGSIFGAIIVSLVASLVSSLGIFRWEALAMGSGIGSSSMMAAGIASVSIAHPDQASQVQAYATTANLIAAVIGIYLTMYISLPLAEKFYNLLTRRQKPGKESAGASAALASVLDTPKVNIPLWLNLTVLSGIGLVIAMIASKSFSIDMVLTYVVLSVMVALSVLLAQATKGKVPALITVITLGTLLSSPISPIAPWLLGIATSVDFTTVITVMLAIAGLSMGKDLPMLRQIGWKIIPVGFVVIAATFLASTVIGEFVLALLHR
ncbi:MAG: DUF3100 domain-containing protein [Arachnia sp.]